MRDFSRIEQFIARVRAFWQTHPDLRFGQLIDNLRLFVASETGKPVFFIEDDEILVVLDKYIKNFDKQK